MAFKNGNTQILWCANCQRERLMEETRIGYWWVWICSVCNHQQGKVQGH